MSLYCCIRVRGRLASEWSERMHGMRITTLQSGDYQESVLDGVLPDQAALQGIIAALGDLNLDVLSLQTGPVLWDTEPAQATRRALP
jgi:hypothetical protein